jgi:transcriptional regulator with XRE-family HTH domain
MSGAALAKKIGTSQSHLSRVEKARGQLRTAQLDKLIKVLNVIPDNIELLIGLEAGANWEQAYEDAFVPGPLQTPDYARAVISSAAPFLRSADIRDWSNSAWIDSNDWQIPISAAPP